MINSLIIADPDHPSMERLTEKYEQLIKLCKDRIFNAAFLTTKEQELTEIDKSNIITNAAIQFLCEILAANVSYLIEIDIGKLVINKYIDDATSNINSMAKAKIASMYKL